jgi:hypothetical protein
MKVRYPTQFNFRFSPNRGSIAYCKKPVSVGGQSPQCGGNCVMSAEGYSEETVIEPVPIQDTYIQGVHRVEFLGRNNVRIHFYSEEDGRRVIVGKIVMAIEDIPAAIGEVMKGTWHRLTHIALTEVVIANRLGRH